MKSEKSTSDDECVHERDLKRCFWDFNNQKCIQLKNVLGVVDCFKNSCVNIGFERNKSSFL